MEDLILEPEFYVDFDGIARTGPLTISGSKIIAVDGPSESASRVVRLKNQAILPGFVNCHSHVFQRALRGYAEPQSKSTAHDDFWTWRDKMYRCASLMTEETFLLIAELTYLEMIEAGFTHVGEFHYLHHQVGGKHYLDPLTMSKALVKAACKVNINLCLLECAYQQNGFSKPLTKEQERFGFATVFDFLAFLRNAKGSLDGPQIRVGAALHSVRAVAEEWFLPINEFVSRNNLPLHVHVSEQLQENHETLCAKGCSPIALLNRHHLLAPHTTLVHATHLMNDDLNILSSTKPQICICPSTEKNLGDGIPALAPFFENGISLCIGTDQHVRMDPFSEAYSLEETERLRLMKRGIFNSGYNHFYEPLLKALTTHGMSSLYPTHERKTLLHQDANLVVVTLPPEYHWHGPEVALNAIMLSYNPSKISGVMVNGAFVQKDGRLVHKDKPYLVKELKNFFKTLPL